MCIGKTDTSIHYSFTKQKHQKDFLKTKMAPRRDARSESEAALVPAADTGVVTVGGAAVGAFSFQQSSTKKLVKALNRWRLWERVPME